MSSSTVSFSSCPVCGQPPIGGVFLCECYQTTPHAWSQSEAKIQWMPFEYKPSQRELFAAMAMQGLLANPTGKVPDPALLPAVVAKAALEFADALIAYLNATPTESEKPCTTE